MFPVKNPGFLKALVALGPEWVFSRLKIKAMQTSGVLVRRTPLQSWDDVDLQRVLARGIPCTSNGYHEWRRRNSPSFFFQDVHAMREWVGDGAIEAAKSVLTGNFPFFGTFRNFEYPPSWRKHPLSNRMLPHGHWSRLDAFDHGDIKYVWELSRFGWAFALVRAYARTADEQYPRAFWHLFQDWMDANPPYDGVNWMCGQETAFRAIAICFAVYGFAQAKSTTPEFVALASRAMSVHASRIEAFLQYARSQKNNHGVSEGVGLWSIGLLFPELKGATRWSTLGKRTIEGEVKRQIYSDGSYVQHSFNYHRLMLQDLAWAIRVGECNNHKLDSGVYEKFERGVKFLNAVTDPLSGLAPNYGANDGALLLPLSDCDYPDMRPVLQSCYSISTGSRLLSHGPWDEETAWLGGASSVLAPLYSGAEGSGGLAAIDGGYYTIRSADSWALMRSASYRDRPSHADQLHLDLWWKGENVLCDPGSYSYNADPPFQSAFAGTMHHNTVLVDGRDQMTRVSRFLWADWANATVNRLPGPDAEFEAIESTHDGYKRMGVTHRRSLARIGRDVWVIVDDILGTQRHKIQMQWLLSDGHTGTRDNVVEVLLRSGMVRLAIAGSAPFSIDVVRGGNRVAGTGDCPAPDRGWTSRFYGRLEPAVSVVAELNADLPVRLITTVTLGCESPIDFNLEKGEMTAGSYRVHFAPLGCTPILCRDRVRRIDTPDNVARATSNGPISVRDRVSEA